MNEEELTIAKAIFEENGNFDIEVELGGSTFAQVRGSVETDGYEEDDCRCGGYMKGTGAWITTYASVVISSLELHSYDDNGNEIPCVIDIHEDAIENYCREQLLRN
jgi:hypothetical protein